MSAHNDHKRIAFGQPMLDEAESKLILQVLAGGRLVHGAFTKEFESSFARRVGVAHAVTMSSCTAGLHLSLHAQGIGPGDTVIVPAMTHVATGHAVEYCGARPVFCDIDPQTGNLDAKALPEAVQRATRLGKLRAIMVVHYLGLPADMDAINAIAKASGATVIEDCALAIDATFDGRKAGTLGLAGCFSFYPVKHITTIEGGMVTTDDDNLAASLRRLRAFGYDKALGERTKPGQYDVVALGYNYRMNEVEAAVGCAQLGKLDEFQNRRARNFATLSGALAKAPGLFVCPARHEKSVSSHYCLNVVLDQGGDYRDDVVAALSARGIETSLHYPSALPLFSYYASKYGHQPGEFPVAERFAAGTISISVGPHLETDDMLMVGQTLLDILAARPA